METKAIQKTITELAASNKRNFVQSFDLLISLKELNLKKTEEQVEFFMQLPHFPGRKRKICALVGPELRDDAKGVADTVIPVDDFNKYDKKKMKQIAAEHDWFLGQANVMPKIAASWGRVLGPRNKMPNPKAGCIVPPKSPLAQLCERLQNTVKISVKKQPNIQIMVGRQDMDAKLVAENIHAVHEQVVHHLPREQNNVKTVSVKMTMTKPVKL